MLIAHCVARRAHVEENSTVLKHGCSGVVGQIFFNALRQLAGGQPGFRRSGFGPSHAELPALPGAQAGNVRSVMARMPVV